MSALDPSTVTQDMVLDAIIEATDCNPDGVDAPTLADILDLDLGHVNRRLGGLLGRKFIHSHEIGRFKVTKAGLVFAESDETIKPGPIPGSRGGLREAVPDCLRARLWRAMRRNSCFTIRDMVLLAAREDEVNARDTARRYFRDLVLAGYLHTRARRRHVGGQGSNGDQVYVVREHTGPIHPRVRKHKDGRPGMYDANLDEWRPFIDKSQNSGAAA